MRHRRVVVSLLAALALVGSACGDDGGSKQEGSAAESLVGLFKLEGGQCAGGTTSGSFFRMINPGGKLGEGPYISNADSPCEDQTWSPMFPGTDGGLKTGVYQPQVDPPFADEKDEATGTVTQHGATESIAKGTPFFAVRFAVATNEKDPQTGGNAPVPAISVDNGQLSGNLSAFAASWNGQHFNQGAPKPDGSNPGLTSGPTGTYDAATKRFMLEWSSQIVGGPFNNFTGVWHFEGTFEPTS